MRMIDIKVDESTELNSRRHGLFKEYVQIRRSEEYKSSDLKVTNDVLMEISLTLAEILDEMRGVKYE